MDAPMGNTPGRIGTVSSTGVSKTQTVRRACADCEDIDTAFAEIADALCDVPLATVQLFVSAAADRGKIEEALPRHFPGIPVVGCTTAGEIGIGGYRENTIVALGYPAELFAVTRQLIAPLEAFSLDQSSLIASALLAPEGLGKAAEWPNSFAVMFADGLSRQEDAIVASLSPLLGNIPLIGGSAGDGIDFGKTFVLCDGQFHSDAALVCLFRTPCPVEMVRHENFSLTEKRMVVTGANPAERLVTEINAEPAAREYARVVDKDPEQLSPFIFAENPVVVRIGGDHYCRSIQKVEENGDLRFYCAIDEGLVLSVAESRDLVESLDEALTKLEAEDEPDIVIGFDCVLRRLEAEMKQTSRDLSAVLSRHNVYGFNTYGEQFGGMHVNQTFTGAAIYPAKATGCDRAEP